MHELLAQVDLFIKRHKLTPTRFGIEATKNPSLYARIRSGNYTKRTADKVLEHLKKRRK